MRSRVMAGFGADGLGGGGGGGVVVGTGSVMVVVVGTGSVMVVVVGTGREPATDGGGDDEALVAPPAAAQPATVRITALTAAVTPQPIARSI
jgi:hypothetical protein